MTRRVVITGIGVVSPIGVGREAFFSACLEDRTAAAPVPAEWERFADLSSRVWAPLPPVDCPETWLGRIEAKQLDPVTRNGLFAAFEAAAHAGIAIIPEDERHRTFRMADVDPERTGVFLGTGVGGIHTVGESYAHQICRPQAVRLRRLLDTPAGEDEQLAGIVREMEEDLHFPSRFNPYTVSMLMPNAPAANIAIKLGLRGPNLTFPLACASGTAAIGHGFRAVAGGEVDVAVTGGSEYLYDPYGTIFRAFDAVKTLAHRYDDPAEANRPFDRDRSGFLFSQGGAAVLVLEEATRALARGASPVAEIVSYAETCDARSIMMMDAEGIQIERALISLFEGTGVTPGQVDYVNAHGTGTEQNDPIECAVIEKRFRPDVLVNSTKALIGHTMGAAGAIEGAVTALSLRHQATHGLPNLRTPIAGLNFARRAGAHPMEAAVSQSFAFGGHNTALLMRRYE